MCRWADGRDAVPLHVLRGDWGRPFHPLGSAVDRIHCQATAGACVLQEHCEAVMGVHYRQALNGVARLAHHVQPTPPSVRGVHVDHRASPMSHARKRGGLVISPRLPFATRLLEGTSAGRRSTGAAPALASASMDVTVEPHVGYVASAGGNRGRNVGVSPPPPLPQLPTLQRAEVARIA